MMRQQLEMVSYGESPAAMAIRDFDWVLAQILGDWPEQVEAMSIMEMVLTVKIRELVN